VDSVDDESLLSYDLQSIVVHVGEYGSGHYYAYVRPDIRKDEWFRFNDDEVTPVEYKDVIQDAFGGGGGGDGEGKNVFAKWFGRRGSSFGWGGRKSSAYMLQYVKRHDISHLYHLDNEKEEEDS